MFGGTKSHRGREAPCYRRNRGGRVGKDLVVEESYGVSSEGVGGLLDLTKPPRTVGGMEPNGSSDR